MIAEATNIARPPARSAPQVYPPQHAASPLREPEHVYLRRRLIATAIAALILTVLLVVSRPDTLPQDLVNPLAAAGSAEQPLEERSAAWPEGNHEVALK